MSSPAVSVVIPAYNAAAFVEKTLDSIRAQTFTDLEVIVVDDGSKDDTHGVVTRYLAEHGLAGRCITQPNKKIAAARNTGIAAAAAPLVAFLDHDDFWAPRKLERVVAEFERDPRVGLVHHPCRIIDPAGRVLGRTHRGPEGAGAYRSLLLLGNAVSPSAVTVRAKVLRSVGGFRENPEFDTVEDYDLWLRLARACSFRLVDELLGDYLMAAGGASKRIVYHYSNLEALLRAHFAEYEPKDAWTRLLMRRRMSQVYRAAGRALLRRGERAEAAGYVARMLREFPAEPKNLALAAAWALRLPMPAINGA